MSEYLGANIVYVGSFNPVHYGHIYAIDECLRDYENVCMFVRYNEGVDLTDWDTKKSWFEELNKDRNGRIKIYKEVNENEKGKKYGIELFFDFIRKTDSIVGQKVDAFYFGDDYTDLLPQLQNEFPDRQFVIGKRLSADGRPGYSSTAIRENMEAHKDWMPVYVYESLKNH